MLWLGIISQSGVGVVWDCGVVCGCVGCVWAENCVGGVFGACVEVCGCGDRCVVGGCCDMFEYTRVCTLVSVQVCKPALMCVEARAGIKCLPLLLFAVFSGNMMSP